MGQKPASPPLRSNTNTQRKGGDTWRLTSRDGTLHSHPPDTGLQVPGTHGGSHAGLPEILAVDPPAGEGRSSACTLGLGEPTGLSLPGSLVCPFSSRPE